MRDARLRRVAMALALAGALIAGYLTWVHYAGISPVCGGSGCERVQTSRWAEFGGVPVALIGLAGYLAILATVMVRQPDALLAGAFLAVAGFAFSQYLFYVQLFDIHAICQWCAASDAVITALAAIVIVAALRSEAPGRARDSRA
jgi:uncharacterized membrane protein